MQLRVVPLDRSGRQEAWVPEFLFTVERITGDEVAAEKWWKAVVTPAQPEWFAIMRIHIQNTNSWSIQRIIGWHGFSTPIILIITSRNTPCGCSGDFFHIVCCVTSKFYTRRRPRTSRCKLCAVFASKPDDVRIRSQSMICRETFLDTSRQSSLGVLEQRCRGTSFIRASVNIIIMISFCKRLPFHWPREGLLQDSILAIYHHNRQPT